MPREDSRSRVGQRWPLVEKAVESRKLIRVPEVVAGEATDVPEAKMREESLALKGIVGMRVVVFERVGRIQPGFRLQLAERPLHDGSRIRQRDAQGGGQIGHSSALTQEFEDAPVEGRQVGWVIRLGHERLQREGYSQLTRGGWSGDGRALALAIGMSDRSNVLQLLDDGLDDLAHAKTVGKIKVVLTNLDTEESIALSIPGPGFIDAEGNTIVGTGPWVVFVPGQLLYLVGRITFEPGPFGVQPVEVRGRSVDLCDVLA